MRVCLTVLALTVLASTVLSVRTNVFADDAVARHLVVCVEHSLPVAGEPCRLWLADEDSLHPPRPEDVPEDVTITFHVVREDGDRKRIDLPAMVASGDSMGSARWTPQRTGPVQITATVRKRQASNPKRFKVLPANARVTSRRMHFNYWQARPQQRFVTSVMDNGETSETAVRWKQRGVMPLGYKSGQWHWAHGYDSVEKMTKLWVDLPEQRAGIVIDEFGGGDDIDQQLGEALLLTRKQRPKMFIAPYCLSVSGPKMIDGYRRANLILVETYTPDWRWDGFITGRWKTAVDAGLKEKSIAVLGLGSQWIGTERELRRVCRMIRATCPEMPGVGFFPDVPPRLMKAVDSAIEDYFLRPVVEARVDGNRYTVRNIGESPAMNVEVEFLDKDRNRVAVSRAITQLKPWADIPGDLPPGAVTAHVATAPDRYTVLSYVPPLEEPEHDDDPRRASLRFRQRIQSRAATNPLERASEMAIVRTDETSADPDQHNNVRSGAIPIPSSKGKAVALSFDIRTNRCWFYGHNKISLVGDGELTLTWARQDHDAGLEGNQPRPALIFKGKDEYVVRDVPTLGFRENETYHVLLAYNGRETVRAIVASKNEKVLWDSGPLPAKGGFTCDKLRFDVNPFPRSEIRVDAKNANVVLRGGGGGRDSPYWLESTLSNLRLVNADELHD